jgi:hypothetical protein
VRRSDLVRRFHAIAALLFALLWTSAGLVFLSVVIATFVTLPARR